MGAPSNNNNNNNIFSKRLYRRDSYFGGSRRELKKTNSPKQHQTTTSLIHATGIEHSLPAFSSHFKLIGTGLIGAGFFPAVSVVAYSSKVPRQGHCEPHRNNSAELAFDQHVLNHSTVISLKFEKNIGVYSMVTFLDHGLRSHLRRVRREQSRRDSEEMGIPAASCSEEDSIFDEYMIRQCQQLVAEELGLAQKKNVAPKGTIVDILSDVRRGRIVVSVNGNSPRILRDCPELAAASINMFTSKHSFNQSLRRNCIKRCKEQQQQ